MIKIIDYKAGNAPSVMHAVEHLGHTAAFARAPGDLDGATHIILPGVGSAGATMQSLRDMGLVEALEKKVFREKAFFLGICVGMQILFEHSQEDDAQCLGWLPGRVVKFDAARVRVPQMGWNRVQLSASPVCSARDGYFYFVNSYHAQPARAEDLWGVSDYDGPFAAAAHRDNIYATQFHAEKSGEAGLALLRGFLALREGDAQC